MSKRLVSLCCHRLTIPATREENQQLKQQHSLLLAQLDDIAAQGARTVDLLTEAVPFMVRHGHLTTDCLAGETASTTACLAARNCGVESTAQR